MRSIFVPVLVVVGVFAGCSPGSGGGGGSDGGHGGSTCAAGSCNGGLETMCTVQTCCQDYQGGFTASEAQSSCAAIHGVYSSIPCRATDLAGGCVLYAGTAAQQTIRYYGGYVITGHAAGPESAQANCDALQGDWIMPNATGGTCSGSSGGGSSSGSSSGGGADGGSGGGDGGTSTFSCASMNGTDLHCYEYKNVSPSELAVLMSSCTATKGTGCPTASLVGCCTSPQMVNGATLETCYYPPLTAAQAEQGCSIQGTWSTQP